MKVLHYLNQFYGQIGGEEMAGVPMSVKETPIGPGALMNKMLAESGSSIIATVICGDNYFSENTETAVAQFKDILSQYGPDVVIAGPAFNAGRYGMACGEVIKACRDLHIDAVSAMNEENPGAELYKLYGYIFPAGTNARAMGQVASTICAFINKMAKGEAIGGPEEEGYFKRGVRVNKFYEKTGAVRAVDMLLDKINGRPFTTELPMPVFSKVEPSPAISDMKHAVIALVTSGGVVPEGNPDHLEALAATKFAGYSIDEYGGEDMPNADVAHGGYDPTFAMKHGNRVIPADALYELKRQGVIGDVYSTIYVTVGNGMPVDRAANFGNEIGKLLKGKADGVILTST